MLIEEDVMVEYDPCDECNRCYSATSTYHRFTGNYTRAEARRLDAATYRDDGAYNELESERAKYEE